MKAVMYGAGSIGRGFIGQVFSESGYETVFVDINSELMALLNERGRYPLRFVKSNSSREITVDNVSGIDARDEEAVANAIARADIMATSVGKNVLPLIAGNIAKGLVRRWENENFTEFNIIVCENMIKANVYLRSLIMEHLTDEQCRLMDRYVGTVETCIGRNVPVMTEDLYEDDPLLVLAEDFSELPIDLNTVKGPVPELKYCIIHAGFDFYIRQKLFVYNMGHAAIAYLTSIKDPSVKRLCDAVRIPDVKYIALKAMTEISMAMAEEFDVGFKEQLLYAEELIYRFGNKQLGIAVPRLAMDPVRKLSENDRLVGAANLCIKHGIKPAYIAAGIAAGFRYLDPEDEYSLEIQEYIKKNGIEKAICNYSRIPEGSELFREIILLYAMFEKGADLKAIIEGAEDIIMEDE